MRPPFAYYGGKTRLARRIVALLPEHNQYVEPFAGGLSVLLAKPRANMEVVNDLDGDLMTFWRVLRDRPDELARVCELTPHSRTEYATCLDLAGAGDDLERARRVWGLLAQGRAGSTNPRNSGWRYRVRGIPYGPARAMNTYVRSMPEIAERLHGVSLECLPALEIIERYGAEPTTLLYVDPPYLGSSRASQHERYGVEQMDTDAHSELAAVLRACHAAVVISGFDSPEYADLFGDWHSHRFATTTNRGGQSTQSVEVLWSNRPLLAPSVLEAKGRPNGDDDEVVQLRCV